MFLNTHRLQVFVQVAEWRSFSRAADRLFLSQPAVSGHIKELERDLGVELFERKGRLTLTPAGAAFLEAAHKLINTVEETSTAIKQLSGSVAGRVAVGISIGWERQLTSLAVDFQRRHPQVFLALSFGVLDDFVQMLAAEQIGIAFVVRRGQDPRLEAEELAALERRYCVICPAEHPLAKHEELAAEELQQYPFIYFSPRRGAPTLEHLGVPMRYVMEVDSREGIVAAVAAGIGVSVLLEENATGLPPGVRVVPLRGPPSRQALIMLRSKHRQLSVAEQAFTDYIVAATSTLSSVAPRTSAPKTKLARATAR